jgi:peptide subunit release factor 1 (eRF1)
MFRFLNELEIAASSGTSLYLPPRSPVGEIEETLNISPEELPSDLAKLVANSRTGAAIFWGEQHRYLVLPPFPVAQRLVSTGFDVDTLRSLLQREFTIALILVRLGSYAIGVFQGEELVSSKVGTGLIHSRHKKGGSSQQRFARHREKQMESFFSRVCIHARERLEPHLKQLDYVIYGGESNTLLSFRRQCRFLHSLEDRTLETLLNVRKPGQRALEATIGEAWSSELIEWIKM